MSASKKKKKDYVRPKSILGMEAPICPGCQYGVVNRLIGEVIDDLGIQGNTVFVAGVGCHGLAQLLVNTDTILALHGRAAATAGGLKWALGNDSVVFTIQGDGDLAAIGIGDTIRSINRGEQLTTIFCNNAGYGTTGGQMAPTSLLGQVTATTPLGRDPQMTGLPFHVAEFVATLPGVVYSARHSLTSFANYKKAKKAVETAFQKQINGVGYGFVEILVVTPTCWKMYPLEGLKWVKEQMMVEYPLGEFKNVEKITTGHRLG